VIQSAGSLTDLFSVLVLGGMLAVSLVNLLAAPRLRRDGVVPPSAPLVSLLIPARDESVAMRENLPALSALRYPRLEILILDDESMDGTGALVSAGAALDERIQLLRGAPLPAGWLGKNWACHQLAERAKGEVLIFCDADVTVHPDAVTATVAALEDGYDALTALPRHRLETWMEYSVVPLVVQLPILSLLPLPLVGKLRSPATALGNGQWIAFRRETYREIGGHRAVKAVVVEDMALARRVKLRGRPLLAALALPLLTVRMYRSPSEVTAGFAKNLYALLGSGPAGLAFALAIFYLAAVHPWVTVWRPGGTFLPLIFLTGVRLLGMAFFRHGWRTAASHPLGATLVVLIAGLSLRGHRRGNLTWRGRTLPSPR